MSTMRLPVPLTDADRLTIAGEMSAAQVALETTEAAKKAATKEFNEEIKQHRAVVHERNAVLVSGKIHRDIEVEVREDATTGRKETWRLDTNTVVSVSDMDPDERQVKLNLGVEQALAKDGAPTEEQVVAGSPEEAEELRERRLAGEVKEREAQDRLDAWLKAVKPKIMVLDILDAEENADKYKASIGPIPPRFTWEVMEVTGQTQDEARDTLLDALASQWRGAEEKAERERQERILAKLGELLGAATYANEPGQPVIAKVDSERWTCEAEGHTRGEAEDNLRRKLLTVLEADDAEVAKLAAEQAADAAKDKPRRGLQAPTNGAQPKKRGKGISINDGNGKDLTPPSDEEGPKDGLSF